MVIRGLRAPILSNKDVYGVEPVVYLNGIPLITDHPFVYNIQQYDVNPIGPATNILAEIAPDNIESMEVIKDPVQLSKLGPLAANGAINIITKNGRGGNRQLNINSYYGFVQPERVSTVNAEYEKNFRQPFYDKYATPQNYQSYPAWLADSTNVNYFGPSRWSDLYYNSSPEYNVDFGLTTGTSVANFRFFGGYARDAGNADNTSLKKYNAGFFLNVAPYKWFHMSSMINGVYLDRTRNRNLRDRFAEMSYIPDLSTPLSPDKTVYQSFLGEYDQSFDHNNNDLVQGYLTVDLNISAVKFSSKIAFDYNEGTRDVFWPSELLEKINYVSNYFGYNERLLWSNIVTYSYSKKNQYKISLEGGSVFQEDKHQYNYSKGYDGTSDFIKVLSGTTYDTYRYTDMERLGLYSVYGSAKFEYKSLVQLNAVLRADGTSVQLPNNRWLTTPSFSAKWNLKNQFLSKAGIVNDLSLAVSWARIGKLLASDGLSAGPQYKVDLGWGQNPIVSSYNSLATLSRPYTSGWIGYNTRWPYSDQLNINAEGTFFNNVLNVSVSLYSNSDKQQMLNIPVAEEYGYTGTTLNGMGVNNKGIDITLGIAVLKNEKRLTWLTSFNMSVNRNKLTSLPNGLDQVVIGDRMLKVGQPADAFWLYQNQGIYNNTSDVPVNPATNKPLSFQGIPLQAGDPRWKDQNGDFAIDNNDKVLMGHSMPVFTGGWNNQFRYKKFDLNFQLFFAVGQKALNDREAARYDFVNTESSNSINTVREIFFWQKEKGDEVGKYPLYNPWSSVVPYRTDQDLFLENASYVKMRSVTLGYDFTVGKPSVKNKTDQPEVYVYATVTNLFTITSFSGKDPEMASLNGIYDGYSLPIPRSIILGIRLKL
jgi:hypothetical protein